MELRVVVKDEATAKAYRPVVRFSWAAAWPNFREPQRYRVLAPQPRGRCLRGTRNPSERRGNSPDPEYRRYDARSYFLM